MTKAEKIDLLDSLVSKYVRLAYADDAGYVQCFTCSTLETVSHNVTNVT